MDNLCYTYNYFALVRVTRLVEFLPNVSMFALCSYVKIAEVAHIFGLLYSMVRFMH
jgi:hypothetical protein